MVVVVVVVVMMFFFLMSMYSTVLWRCRFISGYFNGDPHPGNVLVSKAEAVIEFETSHGDLESLKVIPSSPGTVSWFVVGCSLANVSLRWLGRWSTPP